MNFFNGNPKAGYAGTRVVVPFGPVCLIRTVVANQARDGPGRFGLVMGRGASTVIPEIESISAQSVMLEDWVLRRKLFIISVLPEMTVSQSLHGSRQDVQTVIMPHDADGDRL